MNDEPAARRNFPPKQNRGASAEATSHANWYVAGRHFVGRKSSVATSSVAGLHLSKLTSLLLSQHITRSTKTCRFDKIRNRNYTFWKRGYQLPSHETKEHR